jgi:hypothetical protein
MTTQTTSPADEKYGATIAKLKKLGVRIPARDAWKSTVGKLADSDHFAEAIRLGAEWRASENRKSVEALDGHLGH